MYVRESFSYVCVSRMYAYRYCTLYIRANQVAPRALARRRRENFGDIDCKSLHLGPEIDANHTLLTTTNEHAVLTTCTYFSREAPPSPLH